MKQGQNFEYKEHQYDAGQQLRLIETGETVTVSGRFFISNASPGVPQYNVSEHPGTWFRESELEALPDDSSY